MKNKICELFISILLLGTFFVMNFETVFAEQDGDYTYTINNGVATIIGYTCAGGSITIPSVLGGYPTAIIGDNAFYSCTFVTSVIIPNSVITIGRKAFKSCTSLESVIIGNSVTTIGDDAFYYCTSLSSLTIPNNVTTIGNSTFSYCSSLTSVDIGTNVKKIGNNAFSPCSSLFSIIIPNNVTIIGDSAFSSCPSLSSITIGTGVKTIGNYSFSACPSLSSIIIPNNVTIIRNGAFSSCSSLSSITIGTGVKTIGRYCFASCTSLTSIVFLGIAKPTSVGTDWIKNTPPEIRGHAYATSNFPAPGGVLDFHGLTMGTVISVENKIPNADFDWSPLNATVNQTITFDASASTDPDGSLILYEWDWNNDSVYEETYSTPIATHSWTQKGDYSVTLRVTDDDNNVSTKTRIVTVVNRNNQISNGAPGFELIFVFCALGVILFLFRKS